MIVPSTFGEVVGDRLGSVAGPQTQQPSAATPLSLEIAREIGERAPLQRPYVALAEFYAEAGRPRQARALLAEYEGEIEPELRGAQLPALSFARGKVALAEGSFAAAIDAFRRADTGPCPICVLRALARAYHLDGRPDSAVAIYERYLETPWIGRILIMGGWDGPILLPGLDPYFRAGILRRLGELYEGRNDVDRAVEYYDRFGICGRERKRNCSPRLPTSGSGLRGWWERAGDEGVLEPSEHPGTV